MVSSIVRQADYYGLEAPPASPVSQSQVNGLVESLSRGPRIHAGTMDRSADQHGRPDPTPTHLPIPGSPDGYATHDPGNYQGVHRPGTDQSYDEFADQERQNGFEPDRRTYDQARRPEPRDQHFTEHEDWGHQGSVSRETSILPPFLQGESW